MLPLVPVLGKVIAIAARWWPYYAAKWGVYVAAKQYGVTRLYRRLVSCRRIALTSLNTYILLVPLSEQPGLCVRARVRLFYRSKICSPCRQQLEANRMLTTDQKDRLIVQDAIRVCDCALSYVIAS